MFFSYGVFALFLYNGEYGTLPPEAAFVPLIALLGFCMIVVGVYLLRRFEEPVPMLVKGGGPIHYGEIWNKGTETGLYLTSCRLIVSINQESNATAHVGYGIVSEGQVTCRDCAISEGKLILESQVHGRMSNG